jgi:hypothetical protein
MEKREKKDYVKPETKRHDPLDVVQGSFLYSTYYYTSLYSLYRYYVSLYYYH